MPAITSYELYVRIEAGGDTIAPPSLIRSGVVEHEWCDRAVSASRYVSDQAQEQSHPDYPSIDWRTNTPSPSVISGFLLTDPPRQCVALLALLERSSCEALASEIRSTFECDCVDRLCELPKWAVS